MKKILLIAAAILIGLPILFVTISILIYAPSYSDTNKVTREKIVNIDSLVALIKSDKLFEIKDVYYNPKDSSLNIAFTNKGNVIKEENYSSTYFSGTYNLDQIKYIDGPYLYEYKKGKYFKNGDYNEYLNCSSRRAAKLFDKFKSEYCSIYKECTPLTEYIKKSLNDPGSYESNEISVDWIRGNHFMVTNIFRAKNGFGVLVLQKCTADVDSFGNIYDFKFIQ